MYVLQTVKRQTSIERLVCVWPYVRECRVRLCESACANHDAGVVDICGVVPRRRAGRRPRHLQQLAAVGKQAGVQDPAPGYVYPNLPLP